MESRSGAEVVRDVTRDLVAAWNLGDARAFGALFAEDADYVAGSGAAFHGREAIAGLLVEAHRGSGAGSAIVLGTVKVRLVREDVAIVHADWRETPAGGVASASSSTIARGRRGIFIQVLARQNGRWEIVALQNTDAEPAEKEASSD
jgi:uncharacterized protein (TIGR02246 family)